MTSWTRILPPEHGAWAFVGLGAVAGLVVAPSWAGAAVAVGLLIGVVARHAGTQVLAGARLHGAAALAAAAVLVAWLTAAQLAPACVPWLTAAIAGTLVQLGCDGLSRRHGTAGTIAGGLALAAAGGGVAVAGGASTRDAAVVAGLVAAYLFAAIPLVRARRRPQSAWRWHALAGHALAAGLAAAGAIAGVAPWLLAAVLAAAAVRCWRITAAARPATPKQIGLQELPVLILLLAATIAGLRWGM